MSRKVKRPALAGALALLFVVLSAIVLFAVMEWEYHWSFGEAKKSIANPDRGFYIQVKSSSPHRIADAAEEVRLILLAFDIEEEAEDDLPEEKLEELRAALDMAGAEHVAVIFRAAYGFHSDVTEPGRLELMGRHIEQIAGVLNAYSDRILVVQAGMLGAYGEWHSSRYLEGAEEEKREARLYILRQWDAYLDPGIKVAVRRPRFVREAMEEDILPGRLGIHNDALLSTDSDMGTYDDPGMGRADELLWAQEHMAGQINGGEMPTPGSLSAPENADYEFSQLHMGYLNLKYNEEILNRWSEMTWEGMNAKSFLQNRLGYRLFLSKLDMKRLYLVKDIPKEGVWMQICLCNTGYAPLPEKYRVYVTVGTGEEQVCREVEIPELYRICNGQSAGKEIKVEIPEEFLYGEEAVRIGLKIAPDKDVTDGRDCVELANDAFPYRDGTNGIALLDREGKFLFPSHA